jgi:hypothetical protein
LALRVKDAIANAKDANVKSEIISAASLLKNMSEKPLSGDLFCKQYTLSEDAKNLVAHAFKSDALFTESFLFDSSEFEKVLSYKSVELDNGALISANAYSFNDVFQMNRAENDDSGTVHVTTSGKIVNEKRSRKGA